MNFFPPRLATRSEQKAAIGPESHPGLFYTARDYVRLRRSEDAVAAFLEKLGVSTSRAARLRRQLAAMVLEQIQDDIIELCLGVMAAAKEAVPRRRAK